MQSSDTTLVADLGHSAGQESVCFVVRRWRKQRRLWQGNREINIYIYIFPYVYVCKYHGLTIALAGSHDGLYLHPSSVAERPYLWGGISSSFTLVIIFKAARVPLISAHIFPPVLVCSGVSIAQKWQLRRSLRVAEVKFRLLFFFFSSSFIHLSWKVSRSSLPL